ncbi:hypothetical protein IG631_03941 [Alternaria alternata]|nr:hypothetical protein IG631_03941 [Alternaria alternata]
MRLRQIPPSRRGNNAAKRNVFSPSRYSAWLLGGDLSRHGVLRAVQKNPQFLLVRHSGRTTFSRTPLLPGAQVVVGRKA